MTKLRKLEGAHTTVFTGVRNYEDLIFKRITLEEYLRRGGAAAEEVRPIYAADTRAEANPGVAPKSGDEPHP